MKPQGTETYENISYGYAAYTCKPVYHRCRLVRRKSGGSCIFLDEDNRPRKVTAYYAATLGNGFVRIDPQTGLLADDRPHAGCEYWRIASSVVGEEDAEL